MAAPGEKPMAIDTSHPPDPGGAAGRPAPALLLAGVQGPRAHRYPGVNVSKFRLGISMSLDG